MKTPHFKYYLLYLIGGCALLSTAFILLYNICVWAGLPVQRIPYEALYQYQTQKADASDATTVFIGDSALGNAVNADLYGQLSGEKVQNLALTGSFGYQGSLDMLKRVSRHNDKLKRVILMQTPDMPTRKLAQSYNEPLTIAGLDLGIYNFNSLKLFAQALHGGGPKIPQIENDYTAQGKALPEDKKYKPISADAINPLKIGALQKFADYCLEQGYECIYAHAPVVEDMCKSEAYFEAASERIAETGLSLAAKFPLCIPKHELGDSFDHVQTPFKDQYTRAIFKRLR